MKQKEVILAIYKMKEIGKLLENEGSGKEGTIEFPSSFIKDHIPEELTNRSPLLLRQREAFGHPSQICRTYSIQKFTGSPVSYFQVIIINTFLQRIA